jgi:hypothetical protein
MTENQDQAPILAEATKRRRAAEQARRAQALRENLSRRKAQARARETPEPVEPET